MSSEQTIRRANRSIAILGILRRRIVPWHLVSGAPRAVVGRNAHRSCVVSPCHHLLLILVRAGCRPCPVIDAGRRRLTLDDGELAGAGRLARSAIWLWSPIILVTNQACLPYAARFRETWWPGRQDGGVIGVFDGCLRVDS